MHRMELSFSLLHIILLLTGDRFSLSLLKKEDILDGFMFYSACRCNPSVCDISL